MHFAYGREGGPDRAVAGAFIHAGAQHQAEVRWGKSLWFRFPYELRIDGVLVDQGIVPVENWYVPFSISSIIGIAIGTALGLRAVRFARAFFSGFNH